jgi:Tol biopolymer transport system component
MKTRLISLIFLLLILTGLVVDPSVNIPTAAQTVPTWEGQIAYLGSDNNIWVVNSQEPQPFQVTADASEQRRYYSPRFSPGGDLLAFCLNDNAGAGGSQLFLVRTGAWQPILLVEDVFCQGYPQRGFDWSPDGSSIAYTRSYEYNPQPDGRQWSRFHGIWSVDIGSGESIELVPPPGTNPLIYPLWSPDGRWIRMYELIFQEGLGVLRTWNRENGALYNWLGLGSDLFPGSADWAPDSNRLVFDQVTYVGYPGAGLFTASPDVTGLQQVFADPGRGVIQPLWSPKDDTLAFQLLTYYRNEQTSLMLSAPDGSNLREAFQTQSTLVLLDWSPTGNQLLFVSADSEQVGLNIYDMQSAVRFPVVAPSGWEADWSVLPKGGNTGVSGQPFEVEGFTATGGSLLVYLAENYQLWLLDPANDSRAELSPPLSAVNFWISPSGERLIYADRLLTLEFQPGGSLSVLHSSLPNIPVGDEIHWAPDEKRFSYMDAQERVWLVDSGGRFIEIPGASDLPDWSSDGRFISYCTGGDQLWVVGGGISLREVASPVDCAVEWSSSQPLLAYTQKGNAGPDSDQVYLYDAEKGKSSLAMDGTRLVGWSTDGKFLALKRPGKYGSSRFTFYAVDPQRETLLEVGEHSTNTPGLQGWGAARQDYILGPFQLSPDLNSSDRIADALYEITADGRVILVGDQNGGEQEVICLDMEGGQPTTLLNANLSRVTAGERPGIWAQLSPDGAWTSTYFYDSGAYSYLLTRCDRQRQANLDASDDAFEDSFSSDSDWYVQHVPGESRNGQLLLYNLNTLGRESIPALSSSPAVWFTPPEGVIENRFSLIGQVLGPEGEPEAAVNILVDGEPAATSEQDGSFELSGLTAGEHSITALKGDLVFSPEEHTVALPDDSEVLLFTVQPIPQQPEDTTPGDKQVTQPAAVTEVISATGSGAKPAGSGSSDVISNSNVWIWSIGILLVVFLLVILVFRIFSRRRHTDQPAPDTGSPQPVSKGKQPQATSLLKQGVEQVKGGQNAEGRRILDEVLRDDPGNAIAWLWSGMAATKMKDWRAAERSFKEAKRLGHPKADEALAWLREKRSKR